VCLDFGCDSNSHTCSVMKLTAVLGELLWLSGRPMRWTTCKELNAMQKFVAPHAHCGDSTYELASAFAAAMATVPLVWPASTSIFHVCMFALIDSSCQKKVCIVSQLLYVHLPSI
jgi:hypothetical protein